MLESNSIKLTELENSLVDDKARRLEQLEKDIPMLEAYISGLEHENRVIWRWSLINSILLFVCALLMFFN